jgi:hypothetical protein
MTIADRALVKAAREFRDGILGGRSSRGMCVAVCWPLESLLGLSEVEAAVERLDFPNGLCGALNHVVLRLADGRVLDPTADQFGLEPVYLGPMPDLYLKATSPPG